MTTGGRGIAWISAAVAGLVIAWIDSRPGWDDAGISAAIIFTASALFGALLFNRAWAVALAVGVWVPLWGLAHGGNFGGLLALLPAFAGAYGGALARRAFA